MVSVNSLLVTSIFILFIVTILSTMTILWTINLNNSWNKFLELAKRSVYTNTVYIYILIFLLSISTDMTNGVAAALFIIMTYTQAHAWTIGMENRISWMDWEPRKDSAVRLRYDRYAVTLLTLPYYLYKMWESEMKNFDEMYEDSMEELAIVLGLMEAKMELTDGMIEMYNLQYRMFKYTEVNVANLEGYIKDDEEFQEAYYFWKEARDPRKPFNLVHRLPWKMPYNYESNFFFKMFAMHGLVFYNFFKTTIVALSLMFIYFLYTIFFFKIQFLKQLSVWFVIGMLYFWLMSGFNFFLKRYQYGKFTSQIQRFWKRTNTYFWLIEGFLILLFFYYYLNSSQEPLYMYDYSAINQEFLVSLHVAGLNIILLSLVIYFMYFTMLRINSNSWTQLNLYIIIISSFIFFSFFIETYQFYYVISVFNERLWVFNEEENLWSIDVDNPILRTKHQYLLVCLIAKYWHFLFIFLSWVFFLIKSFERRKVTYVLFGANLQNMIILYTLNFACYLQWFKWIYRRFFDLPYTWFMTNIDNKFIYRLFFEIKLLALNLFNLNIDLHTFQNITYKSLVLWNVDSLSIWKFI